MTENQGLSGRPSTDDSEDPQQILDMLHEVTRLYRAGEEAEASDRLHAMTDLVITASEALASTLFSPEALTCIFRFVGEKAHELSLHLLSFLSVFTHNYHHLETFVAGSQENLDIFLSALDHADNLELASTYADFAREFDLHTHKDLGVLLVNAVVTRMFAATSFDGSQNLGMILRQLLLPNNTHLASILLDYLVSYLNENCGRLMGYPLADEQLDDYLHHLDSRSCYPRRSSIACPSARSSIYSADKRLPRHSFSDAPTLCQDASLTISSAVPANYLQASARALSHSTSETISVPMRRRSITSQASPTPLVVSPLIEMKSTPSVARGTSSLDEFLIQITCLAEALPLAFTVVIRLLSDSAPRLCGGSSFGGSSVSTENAFAPHIATTTIGGAYGTGSQTLAQKEADSPEPPSSPLALDIGIDDVRNVRFSDVIQPGPREEPQMHRSLIPPRHKDLKRPSDAFKDRDSEGRVFNSSALDSAAFQAEEEMIEETILPLQKDASHPDAIDTDAHFQSLFDAHFTSEADPRPSEFLLERDQADSDVDATTTFACFGSRNTSTNDLMNCVHRFLQALRIFAARSAIIINDPEVSTFKRVRLVALFGTLGEVAHTYRFSHFFNMLVDTNFYNSLMHLCLKCENMTALHTQAYSLFTMGMATLREFLLTVPMFTAILHKLQQSYDSNLCHTSAKAKRTTSLAHFSDYLLVNGLYAMKHRTSAVSLFLAVIKFWITYCRIEFSFKGLFVNTRGDDELRKSGDEFRYADSVQYAPNFLAFTGTDVRHTLVHIPGISGLLLESSLKRFLSIFILSSRTSQYFFLLHPVHVIDTPRGSSIKLDLTVPPTVDTSVVRSIGMSGLARDESFPTALNCDSYMAMSHENPVSLPFLSGTEFMGDSGDLSLNISTHSGRDSQVTSSRKIRTRQTALLQSQLGNLSVTSSSINLSSSTSLLAASVSSPESKACSRVQLSPLPTQTETYESFSAYTRNRHEELSDPSDSLDTSILTHYMQTDRQVNDL